MHARDVKSGIIEGKHNQEDFAPTLLGILDIPDRPRFATGKQILLTGHADLKVKLPGKGSAELMKDGKLVASPKNDDQFLFLGLEPGSTYRISAALNSGNSLEEQDKEILLENDSVVEFMEKGQNERKNTQSDSSSKGYSNLEAGSLEGSSGNPSSSGFLSSISGNWMAYLLIGLINLAGLVIIAKLLKKN